MNHNVSILMCAYNSEQTIGAAIESILMQEYNSFELIIINDGSTDETLATIEQYSKYHNRLRVISQTNCGIGVSRNRAIAEATGEWLAFIDADDAWHPQKLSLQMIAAKNTHEADAIVTGHIEFSDDGELVGFYQRKGQEAPQSAKYDNLGSQLLERNFDFHPATVIWRSTTLKRIGCYGTDRNGEDFKPFLNLAAIGGRLYKIESPLYAGRRTVNSLTRQTSNHYVGAIARINAIEELERAGKAGLLNGNSIDQNRLDRGKQRFVRWAIHGLRKGYPKAERRRLATPLLAKISSPSARLIEWLKLVVSN